MIMIKALKNYPDIELVTMAQGGNEQAIDALVCRYRPFVLRLAKRTLVSDAEDITHDVFVKVLLHLDRFEQRSSFTTWLYRITMNQILKAKQNEKLQHSLEIASEVEDGAVDQELVRGESMLRHYLAGMLLCLDEEQRMVIILSDLFKMDHNAAAEALDISPDNFRKRLSRARKDLRSWTENKCSLVIRGNQCQCNRKAQYFLKQGWVDAATGKFTRERIAEVSDYIQRLLG
ncbi:sigma-70 family RNA polymerase sigma factor [Fulvivirgaceae bacterium PWU4]|uniref:Sigma-70 family RNA polymerase sigma factor n=1 Tax=Chryseosolibacter histidini TaxID=2782349 RepID=A0AAP2DR33_9BACT|nr:sigma-70 family RNA polymerase sigma factor [Chryseosolibacter histidini]MBT1699462.1 sigma-70 family RNA polymerase sigma factor [Chryseosolibacter histidini]